MSFNLAPLNTWKSRLSRTIYYLRHSHKIIITPSVKQTVVILGMHRSGTSLTAGILHLLGVNMGDRLLPADKFNAQGYFENQIILDLASLAKLATSEFS